jgi:hypothetical protein
MEVMGSAIGRRNRSPLSAIRSCLRYAHGLLLERAHAQAKIREFEYVDPLTNETVYLSTGARYSVLHVGSKRFFFERTTGRFDGTCTSLEERIPDRLELCD